MVEFIFAGLSQVHTIFWGYLGFILIMVLGGYFTIKSRFFQFRTFPTLFKIFFEFLRHTPSNEKGVHPLKVFFASVGSMIGISNVVGVITALQMGGPGALFWVWIASVISAIIKYSEIFLGMKYRVVNERGGYDGGPMYFLPQVFAKRWVPMLVSLLLCIYGVEIYQFVIVTDSLTATWNLNRLLVVFVLLAIVLYAVRGGVSRISDICTLVMPVFMLLYVVMSAYVIAKHADILPQTLLQVFTSAFTGHAAVGGFAGSTALLAIQHGISIAAYSGDIGIGYDSILQSETRATCAQRQAKLSILALGISNLICTLTILLALTTGSWTSLDTIEASQLVQTILSDYFPYMNLFMPIFLFSVGYTTMITCFCVGSKCASYLNPKWGVNAYLFYASFMLVTFSFLDQTIAYLVMSLAGSVLLMINLIGIFFLRKHVHFAPTPSPQSLAPQQ